MSGKNSSGRIRLWQMVWVHGFFAGDPPLAAHGRPTKDRNRWWGEMSFLLCLLHCNFEFSSQPGVTSKRHVFLSSLFGVWSYNSHLGQPRVWHSICTTVGKKSSHVFLRKAFTDLLTIIIHCYWWIYPRSTSPRTSSIGLPCRTTEPPKTARKRSPEHEANHPFLTRSGSGWWVGSEPPQGWRFVILARMSPMLPLEARAIWVRKQNESENNQRVRVCCLSFFSVRN